MIRTSTPPASRRSSARLTGSVAGFSFLTYVGLLVSFPTGPLIGRALGPASRGELAAVVAFTQILVLLLGCGVPVAVRRQSALGDPQRAAALAGAARYCLLLPAPSILLGIMLAAGPLGGASQPARVGMVLMSVSVPVLVYRGCVFGAARGAGWLRPLGVMQAVGLSLYTVFVVLAFVADRLTLGTALGLTLVPFAVDLVVGWWAARPRWRRPQPVRQLVAFGRRAVLGQVAELSNLRLDQALMLPIAGATRAGEYAVAASVAGLNGVAGQAISSRWYRRLAETAPEGRSAEAQRGARVASLATLTSGVGLCLGAAVLLVPLYGSEFGSALLPLVVLVAGSVPFAASGVVNAVLVVDDKPGRSTLAYLVGTIVTVALLVPAVHLYGTVGAALVSTATQTATLLVLCRFGALNPVGCLVPTPEDTAAVRRSVSARWPRFGRLVTRRRVRTGAAWPSARVAGGGGAVMVSVLVGALVAVSPLPGLLIVGAGLGVAALLVVPVRTWALIALPIAIVVPSGVGIGAGGIFVTPLRAVVLLALFGCAMDRVGMTGAPDPVRLPPSLRWTVLAWCAWMAVCFLRASGNVDALGDLLLYTLETVGPLYLVVAAVRTLADIRLAVTVLITVTVTEAALGVLERFRGSYLLPDDLGLYTTRLREGAIRARGSLPHPIVLGTVAAMGLFLLADLVFRRARRRVPLLVPAAGLGVVVLGLLATQSRGPLLVAVICALVVSVWMRGTNVSRSIAIVLVLGIGALFSPVGEGARGAFGAAVGNVDQTNELSTSGEYRRVLVPVVMHQVQREPLGIGPGTPEGFRMIDRLGSRVLDFYTTIDNAYGVTAVHFGVVGLALQLLLLALVLTAGVRGGLTLFRRTGDMLGIALVMAALTFVLNGLTVATFTFRQGNLMFWVVAGLSVALAGLMRAPVEQPTGASVEQPDEVIDVRIAGAGR